MMHKRLLIGLFIFIVFSSISHAQEKEIEKPYNTIEVKSDFNIVYNQVIDYLHNKGYFIIALDRPSGFIQAKIYTPDKKVFSERMGDRDKFNFVIRAKENESVEILLSIFRERAYRSSVSGGYVYYDRDLGIIQDHKIYIDTLDDIKKSFCSEDISE